MTETNLLNNTSLNSGGFLEPERLVQYFSLEKGDYAADFGAGHGFFTMPMAREVGNGGKIYAFDIQKPVLEVIRAKARINHLLNIEIIWADLDEPGGSRLKDNFIDFAVVANILLSLGMFQISPITLSLPFKLLLFVLVDGWHLIVKGLILGYV